MSSNNFKNEGTKQRALFKLWVRYRLAYVNEMLPEIKVYYSHDRVDSPLFGYHKLLSMLEKRMHMVVCAIMYDNQTNKEIKRYNNG